MWFLMNSFSVSIVFQISAFCLATVGPLPSEASVSFALSNAVAKGFVNLVDQDAIEPFVYRNAEYVAKLGTRSFEYQFFCV